MKIIIEQGTRAKELLEIIKFAPNGKITSKDNIIIWDDTQDIKKLPQSNISNPQTKPQKGAMAKAGETFNAMGEEIFKAFGA